MADTEDTKRSSVNVRLGPSTLEKLDWLRAEMGELTRSAAVRAIIVKQYRLEQAGAGK